MATPFSGRVGSFGAGRVIFAGPGMVVPDDRARWNRSVRVPGHGAEVRDAGQQVLQARLASVPQHVP